MALDPETAQGDYLEALQVWHHRFSCSPESIDKCFENSCITPVSQKEFIELKDVMINPKEFKNR